MLIEDISDKNFKEKVLLKKEFVLVDFWAPWCGPCKAQGLILEKISESLNYIKIYKINIDNNIKIREKYNIMSIPTMIIFKKGKVIDTIIGFLNENQIKKRIETMK